MISWQRQGLKTISPILRIALLGQTCLLMACSSLSRFETALFKDSTLNNLNPAPQALTPPAFEDENGPIVDPVFMRAQADYHFTLGEAYSLEGQSQKAIEEFKLTLVYDPSSVIVRLRLAAEYIRQGLLSEAIEQAEEAVEADPNNSDARMLLGGLYSSLKMFDLALNQYKEIVKRHPDNTDAPIFIGAILAEKKQYDESITYFKKLADNPKYSEPEKAWYYIGRVHLERETKQSVSKAKQAYTKSISLKPDYLESVMALANLYEDNDKKEESRKLLESFQEKFGPDKDIAKHLSRVYLEKEDYDKAFEQLEVIEGYERGNLNVKLQMALILIEQKKYGQAVIRLEDILVEAPESDRIRYYLGAVYEELKDTESAMEHYKKVPSSSIYYPEAVIHVAYILKQSQRSQDAASYVEGAIQLRDDVPQFYAFYASILDDLREYRKAIGMLNSAVDRFPSHTQLRFFLGSMHDRVGETDKTIEQMKKVIEIDGAHVQALNYLAYTYAESNLNLEDAEALARKALSYKPNDGYILDTVGWVLFKRGDLESAIKYLEAAYKIKNNESVILEHLADAYTRKELLDKAAVLYRKAIELEADQKKVQEIRQKLSALEKMDIDKARLPASSSKPQPVRAPASQKPVSQND